MALGETTLSAFRTLSQEAINERDIEKLEELVKAIGELLHVLERRLTNADEGDGDCNGHPRPRKKEQSNSVCETFATFRTRSFFFAPIT